MTPATSTPSAAAMAAAEAIYYELKGPWLPVWYAKKIDKAMESERTEHAHALRAERARAADAEAMVHKWNRVMSEIFAGSEFHNEPASYVARFRSLGESLKEAVKKRNEADARAADLLAALEDIEANADWACYAHTGDEHNGDCCIAIARAAIARAREGA